MKEQIKKAIQETIVKLYPEHKDIEFTVDYAPEGLDADLASNVALVLGKKLGKKPMDIGEILKSVILEGAKATDRIMRDSIASLQSDKLFGVSVAPPGFLNFKLGTSIWQAELAKILKAGAKYGTTKINRGKKARVEYVSANPTGPLHIGNARGGPYGEVICKVLEALGYKILREYIHNDIGGQVEKLGRTVWYWYLQQIGKEASFPEDGYQGEYLREVAAAAAKKLGEDLKEQEVPRLLKFVLDYIFRENLKTLKDLGIAFDLVVKESELKRSGKTSSAIDELLTRGLTRKKEGALWFAPNDEFLEDREAVIIKSNGETTYFASDIAYHKEKFTAGYDLVIDVFGSNHHGHVPKLMALTKIYGFSPDNFQVLLYQYVRVKRGKEVVKMSKRAGTYVTAREVLDEVGRDSTIFMLLLTATNTHVDFDLEQAKDTSEKNPLYRVQYAHARISSILRTAISDKRLGKNLVAPPRADQSPVAVLSLLKDPLELALIRELSKLPDLVLEIGRTYNVHHLPHYLLSLADRFHSFYEKIRVISEDQKLSAARLGLVKGVQTVLANGLTLLGIKPLKTM